MSEAAIASPSRWQEASLERIEAQTHRVVSVFLRSSLGPHEAGQHVDVRLTAPDGYQAQRSYSIASAPGAPLTELVVERLEDGEVSSFFHEIAQPGDSIELRGPIGGHFVWRPEDGGPLLLLAGGSGIAPLMSMVRARGERSPATPALLVYSSRRWEDLIFRQALLDEEARDPGFRLIAITTRAPAHRPADFDRRLERSLLREILARWNHAPARIYACGSTRFVEPVTAALVAEGIAPERIRVERFGGTA